MSGCLILLLLPMAGLGENGVGCKFTTTFDDSDFADDIA